MKLFWKFLASYLIVLAAAALALVFYTSYSAPGVFSDHMLRMGGMMGSGSGHGPLMGTAQPGSDPMLADLDASFRSSVNTALLRAALIAVLIAAAISLTLSYRITQPIMMLAQASQKIAAGQFDQTVAAEGDDEIGDLARAFNKMAADLASTETMRQQLLADVSHELKTPLASITGYMAGLQDGVIPADAETFQKVQDEAGRLQRLVHDLQEVSRAESGQLMLKIAPLDPAALVSETADWLRPQFEDKGVTLALDLGAAHFSVLADRDRLRQVLTNLLGNALQYTPEGGSVTARIRREGQAAHFSIQDTGSGLAQADLSRIFQRFYRVDKSRSRGSGGSGIGLTIAKCIIESSGGRIWAESAGPDQGSIFHFTLPLG